MFLDPVDDDLSGKCEEDETDERGVRFDGQSFKGSADEVLEALDHDIEYFTANVAVADSVKGVQAVGVGNGKSIISQGDADKIAECEARARIARELEASVPPVLGGVDEACL
jgi:hypothetical protein